MNITLKSASEGTGDYRIVIDGSMMPVGFNTATIADLESLHNVDGVDCIADNVTNSLIMSCRINSDQVDETREMLNKQINTLLGRNHG